MHEVSMVTALSRTIQAHLPPRARLLSARAAVGGLEHLDPELMQTAWTAVATDPPLAGAHLHLEREEVRVRCRACRATYAPPDPSWMVCPTCGRARPEILSGTGVLLLSLEVERAAEPETPSPTEEA